MEKLLMSKKEAAEVLGVSVRTVEWQAAHDPVQCRHAAS